VKEGLLYEFVSIGLYSWLNRRRNCKHVASSLAAAGRNDARLPTCARRRAGLVLEKHTDFLRDFRGDTIHPSTLELMYELGLLDEFLEQPHQKLAELDGVING